MQGEEGGRYRPQYLWATLNYWWRAGSAVDPMPAVSALFCCCLALAADTALDMEGVPAGVSACQQIRLPPARLSPFRSSSTSAAAASTCPSPSAATCRWVWCALGGREVGQPPSNSYLCLADLLPSTTMCHHAAVKPLRPAPCSLIPCQIFASGNYVRKGHRRLLLRHIAASPKTAWPPSNPFNFKNQHRQGGGRESPAAELGGSWEGCWAREMRGRQAGVVEDQRALLAAVHLRITTVRLFPTPLLQGVRQPAAGCAAGWGRGAAQGAAAGAAAGLLKSDTCQQCLVHQHMTCPCLPCLASSLLHALHRILLVYNRAPRQIWAQREPGHSQTSNKDQVQTPAARSAAAASRQSRMADGSSPPSSIVSLLKAMYVQRP